MSKLTVAEKVRLIERGVKLDKKIKKAQAELDIVKAEIKTWDPDTYATESGCSVVVSTANAFTEPDVDSVYKWFKKNLSVKAFLKCVKVKVEDTKKLMGEVVFDTMRDKLPNATVRLSFKSVEKMQIEAGTDSSGDKIRLLKL